MCYHIQVPSNISYIFRIVLHKSTHINMKYNYIHSYITICILSYIYINKTHSKF